jgi:ADP-ribose pyrophosphatase
MTMSPKKWELLSARVVLPDKYLPVEIRTYRLPNGKIVDDFSVTTIGDVSMVVPITFDKKVVLVNQFKPGAGDVILEFPAGRIEPHHGNFVELAQAELEEEAGIRVSPEQLREFAVLNGFPTKGTEKVHFFLATDCRFNSKQHLDENETIEIVTLPFAQMDAMILEGVIWSTQTIAGWELSKKHFPEVFG